MWKTQKRTANGWEPDREFPTIAAAWRAWRQLILLFCKEPMRLVNARGQVVDEINTEGSEQ